MNEEQEQVYRLLDLLDGGKGIALGKIAEEEGLECDMNTTFKRPVTLNNTLDVGGNINIASGASYKINGAALSASDVGAVPTTRTVNNKALSSDITLSASDVGAAPIDLNGNVTANSYTITGAASPIGTTRSANLKSNKSVANNTPTALLSLELEAGTWLAIVGVRFPSNSTGYRKVNISATSGANEAQYLVPPTSGEVTQIVYPKILTPTATTTYYLNVRHTAGTSLSMPGGETLWANYIQAIQIQ